MDWFAQWLSIQHPNFSIVDTPMSGRFGLVMIMEAKSKNAMPQRIAAKTVLPDSLHHCSEADIRSNFEREIRTWLRLPLHRNVLQAISLDFMRAPETLSCLWPLLPVVGMTYCDGSVRDWINKGSCTCDDALLAIAQICNGLRWLYEHGIDGHGDLKPENILRIDCRKKFRLDSVTGEFPSSNHPWQIKIADLGWANAWHHTSGVRHLGWRPYCAPERIEGSFVAEKSDIFAVGIMTVELLQGLHPTGKSAEQVSKWSERKWVKCIETGKWKLDGIPHQLRDIVNSCLSPIPSKRPTSAELQAQISACLMTLYSISTEVLDNYNLEAREFPGNRPAEKLASASRSLALISDSNLNIEIQDTLRQFETLPPNTLPEHYYDWLETAKALTLLYLRRGSSSDHHEALKLCQDILNIVVYKSDTLDLRQFLGYPIKSDSANLNGCESWEALFGYGKFAMATLSESELECGHDIACLLKEFERTYGWRASYPSRFFEGFQNS